MPECPECKTSVDEPTKVWSITLPTKVGSLVERQVGLYECSKCTIKFPYVYGVRGLKIVSAEVLQKIHADNAKLLRRTEELAEEKQDLQARLEKIEIDHLASKVKSLQESVDTLKEWKKEVQSQMKPLTLLAK